MLTSPQSLELDRGSTALLVCEFADDRFNLFDNPIVWRKHQLVRRRPTSSGTTPFSMSARVPLLDVEIDDDDDDDDDNGYVRDDAGNDVSYGSTSSARLTDVVETMQVTCREKKD